MRTIDRTMKNGSTLSRYIPALTALGIIAVTAALYRGALAAGFVNWDDPVYVVHNKLIRTLSLPALARMGTSFHAGYYLPLVWTTYAVIHHFHGLDPRIYHLVNVVFHCANAALVFALFSRLLEAGREYAHLSAHARGARGTGLAVAGVAALLWSVHPLRVESVAWITELKDVGSTFFFLLGLLAYARYAAAETRGTPFRSLSLLCFALSLLYKQSAIVLPLVMLCLDVWPFGRLRRLKDLAALVREKIAFFCVSIVFGILFLFAHASVSGILPFGDAPFLSRVTVMFDSVLFYLSKILVPVRLFPFYPITASSGNALSVVSVVAISGVCFIWGRGKRVYLSVAWLAFLITLLPSLGIAQVTWRQAAADRFTYVPAMSVALLMAAGAFHIPAMIHDLALRRMGRAAVFTAVGALLCWFGASTIDQIKIWKDPLALWSRAARGCPHEVEFIHANLAEAYMKAGETEKAIGEYRIAIALNPRDAGLRGMLVHALQKANRPEEATAECLKAIAMQ